MLDPTDDDDDDDDDDDGRVGYQRSTFQLPKEPIPSVAAVLLLLLLLLYRLLLLSCAVIVLLSVGPLLLLPLCVHPHRHFNRDQTNQS